MKNQQGFTLIELAIVLVIVTLLIGGLAMPLSAQIQARRIAETRADMNAIRDALIGYAMSHTTSTCTCAYTVSGLDPSASTCSSSLCPASPGLVTTTGTASLTLQPRHYLPCPDDGSASPGMEATRSPATGRCPATRGTLPWLTLGVKGQDAWGNRYTYAVTQAYSNDQQGFVSTPAATPGDLNIFPDASCVSPSIAASVPVVVVSHGPNSRGAQNMSGGTPLAATALPADERHNLIAPSAIAPCNLSSFVSRTPNENFDDLVIWLSANELFNRVCQTGGCP